MFTNQALVVLAFKTANLGIILILAARGYKKYLKPLLVQMLHDQHAAYHYLYTTKNALDEQQHAIQERAQVQQRLSEELSRKVQEWYTCVEQQKKIRTEEVQILQQQLSVLYKVQQERMLLEKVRKQAGMYVIQHMEDDLTHSFAHTQAAHDYLHTVVESLKEQA